MTSEDRLLSALARRAEARAAEADPVDPQLGSDDPPLAAEVRRSVVTEILRRQRAEPADEPSTGAAESDDSADRSDGEPPPSLRRLADEPTRRPWPQRRRWSLAAALAVAMSLVVWWSLEPPRDPQQPMPAYRLDVRGETQTVRGAESRPATEAEVTYRITTGNRLDVRLQPEDDVPGSIDATAWRLVGEAGEAWQPWPVEISVAGSGAARLVVTAGDVLLPVGEHRVRIDLRPVGGPADAGRSWWLHLIVVDGLDS